MSPFWMSLRFHCPMHGPHALARTVAPMALRSSIWPSRRMVAKIWSEPGVTRNVLFAFRPCSLACRAMCAERLMSS